MLSSKFLTIYYLCILLGNVYTQDVCNDYNRDSKMSKATGFDIMKGAKAKLLIKSFTKESESMCMFECGIDCGCLMTIYENKKCELYKSEAENYLNKTETESNTFSIYYKKDMLTKPLYIQNGNIFLYFK